MSSSDPGSSRPLAPDHFEYVSIRVADLPAATRYYERYIGLEVVERTDELVLLRAGLAHHAIELVRDPSATVAVPTTLGWSVCDPRTLADLADRLSRAGYPVGSLAPHNKEVSMDGFSTVDPNGMKWEFVTGYFEFAERPFAALSPIRVLHPFLVTNRYHETVRFACEVCGFLPSDYIADITAFVRAEDRYHHSLAILSGERFAIDHVNFLMESFEHIMRARARILYEGVPVKMDLVHHSASDTIAFYLFDPRFGPPVELSFGHRIIPSDEHETHRPRRLAVGARNELDTWRVSDDDWRET